jgi:hypothetical protein
MYMLPADEQRISDVERGRTSRAVVPLRPGESLSAGDTILFALSQAGPGQLPAYVKGGDCVVVLLTEVTQLSGTDPASGQPLVQITWNPLGQIKPAPPPPPRRPVKPRVTPEKA